MDNVNKTLYIPLYGKAHVSRKGIILSDPMAERIWNAEGFPLRGKSRSKWLAYYMGMRSAVYDQWLREKMKQWPDAVVVHMGCGLDSRVHRVGTQGHSWMDVDFPEVIQERRRYYEETDCYHMISGDIRQTDWLAGMEMGKRAIVVMEGVSMYLTFTELQSVFGYLQERFEEISLLMDCYTTFAAKASRYKNPIRDVGVSQVYGLDDPSALDSAGIRYLQEQDMTPQYLVNQLQGMERTIFRKVYGGKMSRKLYRMYEFEKK